MPSSTWMRPELRRTLLAAPIVASVGASALAANPPVSANESAAHADPPAPSSVHPHAVYLDAFGRGGLWGLGYDYQLTDRLSLGGTGSFYVLDGQRIWSASPYLGFYPVTSGHHRWLLQVGPQVLHTSTPSPVPEWKGVSSTGVSGVAATGYEYRSRFLFRAYAMAAIGAGGVTPWAGFSVGWTL